MGVIDFFVDEINSSYSYLSRVVPPFIFEGVKLFFFAIFIVLAVSIIWLFYKTLSKRNFITLNLWKYNYSKYPDLKKSFAVLFYFIENIFIMPALILLWFTILSVVFLLIVSEGVIIQLLFLTAAIVMAIRFFAYCSEEVSKELGKLFPFIALSIFLLTPGTLDVSEFLSKLRSLPALFDNIVYYLIFILIFEIVLRVGYTLFELAKGKEEVGDDEEG